MHAWGWDLAEVKRQANEPNVVGAHRFDEFLEAFRAGMQAARKEDDPVALASYKLGVCVFETASMRAKIAAQANGASPGSRVAPKTFAPPPAMTNSANPGNGGFVAPPK